VILFAATIGLSAFLLFLVQPVIAKQILPWFGGSAAVWTTCMVFFQVTLLAGYFYSDWVIRNLKARQQAWLHGALLLVSLLVLPITPSEALKPVDGDNPIGRILTLLAVTIGLPYLMLSTTGPLVQAWFARRFAGTPTLGSVWRLYALSNIASMLALVLYPPLIEPAASTRGQSLGWSLGYAVFVLLTIASAVLATRPGVAAAAAAPPAGGDTVPDALQAAAGASAPADVAMPETAPGLSRQLLWLSLSAGGSLLLLAVTSHITQNVASVPFLWVLPLAIYLISFILTFDGRGWYWQRFYQVLAGVMAALMLGGLTYRPNHGWTPEDGIGQLLEKGILPIDEAVPLYAYGLFVLCMFLHGELVQRKPAPAHLTRFYLMVSLGGAIGGLLVGVVAPLALNWYWELPVALLAVGALALAFSPARLKAVLLIALIGGGFYGWRYVESVHENVIEISRNFYGTLRVKTTAPEGDPAAVWRMMHGVITHGEQYRADQHRRTPTSYYGPSSGVAQAIFTLREMNGNRPQRVGLIGMGVGTLAAYGREGDLYRFYELNPAVLDLAQRRFTYLADTAATLETPLGDARLVLEREAPQRYDVLAVDAFSSDSIPVHLITREAMQVYRRHLAEGGVVAFHISNRYLNLQPVVQQIARDAGLKPWLIIDDPEATSPLYKSDWVLVTANEALLFLLKDRGKGIPLESDIQIRPWTDDYNNLFDVLK
jgi:hypothetical protein